MHILICGGAGYIGSHMAKMLAGHGHAITIFDNLSTGHRKAVKWGTFIHGDLLNRDTLTELFDSSQFHGVMHFSARSLVSESMRDPALYYQNNVVGTFNLLEAMRRHGVGKFVFSSSAAVYGNPLTDLINEGHSRNPINPYGETKLIVERMLRDYGASYGLTSVSLRYFNAAGADPTGAIGESHQPETHLIPNVLKAALYGEQKLQVFGNDYHTNDGTCIRDYIHVNDLCQAHLKAFDHMTVQTGKASCFNLGIGRGFSILEIIKTAESIVGQKIPFEYAPPRPGDPPILVADSRLAQNTLGWTPQYTDIAELIETAWQWHCKQSY